MCSLLLWSVCHLSLRPLARRAIAVYPPTMDEQPLDAGIFDLATRRKCDMSPYRPVGSYPTFSPLPRARWPRGGHFLSPYPRRRRRLSVRKCDALRCPDFPLYDKHRATDLISAFFYFYDANLTLLFRFHNFFISFIPSLFKLFLKFAFYIL